MTKDEIRTLIQGITKENTTEVLHADILTALLDMIPEGGGSDNILDLSHCTDFNKYGTKEEVALHLGITTEQIDAIFENKYIAVKLNNSFSGGYAYFSHGTTNNVGFYAFTFDYDEEVFKMIASFEIDKNNANYESKGGDY